jgi:hypothetical protein
LLHVEQDYDELQLAPNNGYTQPGAW